MAGRPLGFHSLVRALAKLSPVQIRQLVAQAKDPRSRKIVKLERERKRHLAAVRTIERQIAALSKDNGQAAPRLQRRRRRMSAETRRKMAEAAKRRWAKSSASTVAAGSKPKTARKPFSAETRAKMAESQKRRWEKLRATEAKA